MDVNDLIKELKDSKYPVLNATVAAHNLNHPSDPQYCVRRGDEWVAARANQAPTGWFVTNRFASTMGSVDITDPELLAALTEIVTKQAEIYATRRAELQAKLDAINELLKG